MCPQKNQFVGGFFNDREMVYRKAYKNPQELSPLSKMVENPRCIHIGYSEPIVTGLLIGEKKGREARGSYFV